MEGAHVVIRWADSLGEWLTRRHPRIFGFLGWCVCGALFLGALFALRWQLVSDLGLNLRDAGLLGLYHGLLRDVLMLALIVTGVAVGWGATGFSPRWPAIGGVVVIWLATLAGTLHFTFFGSPMDWWVVRLYWRDIFLVGGSALQLGGTTPVVCSGVLLSATVAALVWITRTRYEMSVPTRLRFAGTLILVASLVSLLTWRGPEWLRVDCPGPAPFAPRSRTDRDPCRWWGARPLNDHIVRMWLVHDVRTKWFEGVDTDWITDVVDDSERQPSPSNILAAYRDYGSAPPADSAVDAPELPLYRRWSSQPEQTQAMRQRLGLPATGPIHVVLLFLESVRAYELLHDKIGIEVFPRLRRILDDHAIHFSQAYTSSFTAGQTVRGQFSTLCSVLPNVLGAATYIAHNGVRVACIADFLKDKGYHTIWMNTHSSTFHGKRRFETLHGTQSFYDDDYYRSRGISQRIGHWGLADEPFLVESVRTLEEIAAADERPIFANILTISSHHPYSVIPQGPVPQWLIDATVEHAEYRAYLSRLIYVDLAVGAFFDTLFASTLADNTVVVLVGDHSSPTLPYEGLGPEQEAEVKFRIPIALITKGNLTPGRIADPVHQIDVAPTIARLVGGDGHVSWMGKGLFAAGTSPWIYAAGDRLFYRTGERGCYEARMGKMLCFDTAEIDPMMTAAPMTELPERPRESHFFREVLVATRQAIVFNQLVPRALSASPQPAN